MKIITKIKWEILIEYTDKIYKNTKVIISRLLMSTFINILIIVKLSYNSFVFSSCSFFLSSTFINSSTFLALELKSSSSSSFSSSFIIFNSFSSSYFS